ncbi:MAG: hypothetical protein L0Y67_08210 [Gammaproteobacteria bacterium]|nr:hypothetical protein [Gammaproteobacteria bacterium]MCI0591559.1 hypothetical protein [Gammaproteobacteria bacterium]
MKRILALVLAWFAFSAPSVCHALGLGELQLNSSLNQPFDARIELLMVKPEELDTVNIRLADTEAFRDAGVDRPFILSRLHFELIRNEKGADFIRISSSEPIREPFLDFLLEVNWSNGRMLREYTVLLDPPVYEARLEVAKEIAAPAEAPRLAPPLTRPTQAPAMPGSAPASSPTPEPLVSHTVNQGPGYREGPAAVGGEYGPVVAGDTLWSLAKRFRPDNSVSVQQMMLAMLRTNPKAFARDNVNGLFKGYILHIPDREEILALTKAEALAEVKSQYGLWDEYRQRIASMAGPRTVGAGATAKPGAAQATRAEELPEKSELRLVSPSKEGVGTTQQVGEAPADGTPAAELAKNLALANETMEALRQENADIKNRLSESEELVVDLRRLISLKDDQLAALQAELAKAQAEAKPEAEPAPPDQPIPATTEPPKTAAATAKPPAMQEGGLEEEQVVVVSGSDSPAQTSPGPIFMVEEIFNSVKDFVAGFAGNATGYVDTAKGFVMGNTRTLLYVAGGLVLLLLGYAFVTHRARQAEEAELIELPGFADEALLDISEPRETEDVLDVTKAETVALAASELPKPAASAPERGIFPMGTEAASSEVGEDPLAEINIYLAYERFDQAEEFVKAAIKKSPGRHDYKLKLLEVYYAANNKKAYEEYARVLRDAVGGDGPIWEMAEAMWQEMSPGRALFEPAKPGEDTTPFAAPLGASTGSDVLDITRDEEPIASDITLTYSPKGEETFRERTSEVARASEREEDAGLDFELDVSDTTEPGIGQADEVLDLTRSATSDDEEEMLDITVAAREAFDTGAEILDITGPGARTEEGIKPVLDISSGHEFGGDEESMLDITAGSAALMSSGRDLLDVSLTSQGTLDSREDLLDVTSVEEPKPAGAGQAPDMEPEATEGTDIFDISASGQDIDAGEVPQHDYRMEFDVGGETVGNADELDVSAEAASEPGLDFEWVDILDTTTGEDSDDDAFSRDTIKLQGMKSEEEPEFADTVSMPRSPDAEQQSAADEAATKLDLAKAYIELGDSDSAKTILDEVVKEGTDEQKHDAKELLKQVT